MRKDITHWTRGCLTCASWNVGRPVKPLLTPIPVGGPFDRVGVDVLQLPLSRQGNRYAVLFFAYRCSMQSSTMESPFFLLYGRDPRLPTETALTAPIARAEVDLATCKEQVVQGLTEAWGLAQSHVCRVQDRQKKVHDQHAVAPSFLVGDRVFLYEPAAKSSKAHKFARPFSGPHMHMPVSERADIRPVDKPQKAAIHVSLNRLCPCPVEVVNQECTTVGASLTSPVDSTTSRMKNSLSESSLAEYTAWTGRHLCGSGAGNEANMEVKSIFEGTSCLQEGRF